MPRERCPLGHSGYSYTASLAWPLCVTAPTRVTAPWPPPFPLTRQHRRHVHGLSQVGAVRGGVDVLPPACTPHGQYGGGWRAECKPRLAADAPLVTKLLSRTLPAMPPRLPHPEQDCAAHRGQEARCTHWNRASTARLHMSGALTWSMEATRCTPGQAASCDSSAWPSSVRRPVVVAKKDGWWVGL